MAIRNIVKEKDPFLRKRSKEVTEFNERLAILLDDMAQTMRRAEGMGLAAVQVGVLKRVFIVETEDKLYELINPTKVSAEGEVSDIEGCLSVPGYKGMVTRPKIVTMNYFVRYGKPQTVTLTDYAARALCHEYDHLDGILFGDKMTKKIDLHRKTEA